MHRSAGHLVALASILVTGCLASGPRGPHHPHVVPPPAPPVVVAAPAAAVVPSIPVVPLVPPAPAAVLPALFADHMVLQSGKPIPVWGRTPQAGGIVEAQLLRPADGAVVARASGTADAVGQFTLTLPPVPFSQQAHTLRLTAPGHLPVEFADVLIGEVWVCSGQSNMQFALRNATNGSVEVARATNALIRLFKVPNVTALQPRTNVEAQWQVAAPDTAQGFSAVGYFFGRDLHAALEGHPPIGLIGTSWGGTPAQAWTSLPALQAGGFTNYTAAYAEIAAATNPTPERLAQYEADLAAYTASTRFPDRAPDATAAAPATPDADWPTLTVPGLLEKIAGFQTFNGAIWLRRSVDIPAAWAGRDLTLELGVIDDCDKTFFNGELVGETDKSSGDSWQKSRSYKVPARLVTAGPAVLAVRVFDDYANGGIVSGEQRLAPADGNGEAVALSGLWRYRVEYAVQELKKPIKPGEVGPHTPSALYNAMIHPLIPYAIAGAIWYQGESNASKAEEYRTLFPAMIQDWRTRWGQGDFPFLWAQLANFMTRDERPSDPPWARLREAQTMTLRLPATGQAILIDVGEEKDIHPRDKQSVGYRLSLAALRVAYGRELVSSGPFFKRLTAKDGALVVEFDSVGGGLVARGDRLQGFAVAGADGVFLWADARIEGQTVVVRHADVTTPVAVRYAWANNPAATLYNQEGLPACPFDARLD